MSKFDEILNSSDASDALLGEQIDKLDAKLEKSISQYRIPASTTMDIGRSGVDNIITYVAIVSWLGGYGKNAASKVSLITINRGDESYPPYFVETEIAYNKSSVDIINTWKPTFALNTSTMKLSITTKNVECHVKLIELTK